MRFKQPKAAPLDYAGAEEMAAHSLAFLTSDPLRLNRFLTESGMDPQQLALSLTDGSSAILAAALDHIVCDESLLLVFASDIRRKPEEVVNAHALLQGPAPLTSL